MGGDPMSALYTLWSDALNGFYQSDFYVVAKNESEARAKIRKAFSDYLLDPENAYRFDTIAEGCWPTEEEAQENYNRKMRELELDLPRLKLVEGGIKIEYSI